jgi:hypothetical protein
MALAKSLRALARFKIVVMTMVMVRVRPAGCSAARMASAS